MIFETKGDHPLSFSKQPKEESEEKKCRVIPTKFGHIPWNRVDQDFKFYSKVFSSSSSRQTSFLAFKIVSSPLICTDKEPLVK